MFKILATLALTLLPLLLGASQARAEVEMPMIEVGGGVESQNLETFRVLLRVGIDGFTYHRENRATLVIATIRGNFATLEGDDGRKVPYMDLEFVPLAIRRGEGLQGGSFRVLASRFGTNVHLNEDATVRVDVIGIEKATQGPIGAKTFLYAKVAADAIGYKLAARVSGELGTFHGGNLAAAAIEGGINWLASEAVKMKFAFGALADLSAGTNLGDPSFALYSDFSAYSEISLEIKKLFRFFVRNALNGNTGRGFDTQVEYQLMAGAQVIF